MARRGIVVLSLSLGLVGLVAYVGPQLFERSKSLSKQKAQWAGINFAPPTYSGKPCADRPGAAYPNEGSGVCRGNNAFAISLPSLGMRLIYNSQGLMNQGLGWGWTLTSDSWIEKKSETTAFLHLEDGTTIELIYDVGDTEWVAKFPALFADSFKVKNSTTLERRSPSGKVDTYRTTATNAAKWVLVNVSSRQGTELAIDRSPSGVMSGVTNYFGQKNIFSLDANGNIAAIQDFAGKAYTFKVDLGYKLTTVTYPNGDQYLFSYQPGGALVNQVTNPRGEITRYDYFVNDGSTALSKIVDREGVETIISYQSSGLGNGSVTTSSFSGVTEEKFTLENNQTFIETDLNDSVISEVIDAQFRVIETTDFFGGVTKFNYPGQSPYAASVVQPDGTTVTYVRDANNLVTQTTETYGAKSVLSTIARDSFGSPTLTKLNGAVLSSTTYDSKGNRTAVTDAAGGTTQFTYNAQNLPTKVVSTNGISSYYVYDSNGNPIQMTAPTGIVSQNTFTSLGKVASTSSTDGSLHIVSYDEIARPISTKRSEGATSKIVYQRTVEREPNATHVTQTTGQGNLIPFHSTTNNHSSSPNGNTNSSHHVGPVLQWQ